MKYKEVYKQEISDWCLPASLQTLLKRRGSSVSQAEIAHNLHPYNGGFDLDLDLLNQFLQNYDLKADFYSPNTSQIELDLFLSEQLEMQRDILAALNRAKIVSGLKQKNIPHVVLIEDYNTLRDIVKIVDPANREIIKSPYNKLRQAIDYRQDSRYGLYTIN